MENPKISPTAVEMELEVSENSNRKQTKQPVSIPFVWEEKPGTPKKDWKPIKQTTVNPVIPPPVKFVVSIPFKWEEKPGKPLLCFSRLPPEAEIHFPSEKLVALELPPADSRNNNEGIQDRVFESAIEAGGYETPSSPVSATDSSRSSYATGTTSLVGAPFLECLFPLLSPDSGFLEKLGCSEKSTIYTPRKVPSRDFDRESNCSVAVRPPQTLGELIMMSRRGSYRRKAVQMRRQKLSMESIKNRAIGCCIFGINRLQGLQQKWKRHLRLKLM
ncbi:uncharacterized protein LOC130763303 [Actinidia eriantha]|uniref:uncharacterized protein LOC130763303 n=1 Tax=Actinidia eriantha TaxID=165200 RepID=UPI002587FC4E|nr:uncharacterized protein LOC130763303 [Actinidia eriantha]